MVLLYAALRAIVTIAICFLIADLLVAVVHWAEDCYGDASWPIIGAAIIAPNLLHHAKPRAFLANSWWQSANLQVGIGVVVLGGAALLGWFSLELLLIVVLAANANEFHRWAHRTRAENGRFISFLQDCRLVQTRAHHGRHHGGRRDSHYAAITCWADRCFEAIGLWRGLERIVLMLTGVAPRIDPAVAARAAR